MGAPDLGEYVDPPAGPASVLVSAEQLNVDTEWVAAGRLRVRRRIVTETRTIEVRVRREVFEVDTSHAVVDAAGRITGAGLDELYNAPGPTHVDPPPPLSMVFVQREEVPEVRLRIQPYEQVAVYSQLAHRLLRVDSSLAHEEVTVDVDAPNPGA